MESWELQWLDLTRLNHRSLVPDSPWEYCRLKVESGVDETLVLASEGQWSELRREARKDSRISLPAAIVERPWLLGLWWQVAPQRLNPDTCRVFANAILPEWGASL